jgi:hypothetical protein
VQFGKEEVEEMNVSRQDDSIIAWSRAVRKYNDNTTQHNTQENQTLRHTTAPPRPFATASQQQLHP